MSANFNQLIQQNGGRIRQVARRYGGRDEVEDLYQEILLQIWRSYPNYRGDSKIETWIYRVALNVSMGYLGKSIKSREAHQELVQTSVMPENASDEECQGRVLSEFTQALPEVDASILMMYLDGLTTNEMADVLGMKVNAISVRINRMKQRFIDSYVNE